MTGLQNLRLRDEGREMVYKGTLNKRDGEIQVYLFDHALLFTKLVKAKQHEQYKVYRRVRASFVYLRPSINGIQPIPLELLLVTTPQEEPGGTMRVQQRKNQTLVRKSSFDKGRTMPSVVSAVAIKGDSKTQHSINFIHLGRKYYNLVLWASTPMSQRKWYEIIWKQQQAMRDRSLIFDTINLSEGFFSGPNKVNCAAPYSGWFYPRQPWLH